MASFWIGVASLTHVRMGVAGGFAQFSHGKKGPLQRMRVGDGLIYYSPRTDYPGGEVWQRFTAIGTVTGDEPYQVDMGGGFTPFRVDVKYLEAAEVSVRPLLPELTFIKDQVHWGAAFRFGQLKISAHDFRTIAEAMGRDFASDFEGDSEQAAAI